MSNERKDVGNVINFRGQVKESASIFARVKQDRVPNAYDKTALSLKVPKHINLMKINCLIPS